MPLSLTSELAIMMVLGWTRPALMHGKTVLVEIRALESPLDLKFEFKNEVGRELGESETSNENFPNLILF
jgi:hypothetical protein